MVEFTNVNEKTVTRKDFFIKNVDLFKKDLEKRLNKEFFTEKIEDPLNLCSLKIKGTKKTELNDDNPFYPINYYLSVGPGDNKRVQIERNAQDIPNIYNYKSESYIRRLVEITSNSADEANKN